MIKNKFLDKFLNNSRINKLRNCNEVALAVFLADIVKCPDKYPSDVVSWEKWLMEEANSENNVKKL